MRRTLTRSVLVAATVLVALFAGQPAASKPAKKSDRSLPALEAAGAKALREGAVPLSGLAFPADVSAEPEPDAWGKAALVGRIALSPKESCLAAVLGDWVRLRCESLSATGDGAEMLAAVWGVAGDVSTAQADTIAVPSAALERVMKEGHAFVASAASAFDVTFQLRRGSATLLEIVRARWAYEFYNGNTFQSVDAGIFIDASWALGEKLPTLIVVGARPF